MRVLLDGNIYDKLATEPALIKRIKLLTNEGKMTVICNQIVERELLSSPHNGIPDWFAVQNIIEPGAFIGYALIAPDGVDYNDERYAKIMPDISVYSQHRGSSCKTSDAIIADTSSRKCDYLVSEDQRLVHRMNEYAGTNCKGISFTEFEQLVSAKKVSEGLNIDQYYALIK